jgi:hypothetical protein
LYGLQSVEPDQAPDRTLTFPTLGNLPTELANLGF